MKLLVRFHVEVAWTDPDRGEVWERGDAAVGDIHDAVQQYVEEALARAASEGINDELDVPINIVLPEPVDVKWLYLK